MNVHDLETPSVLIDLERMERNIKRMQDHCAALGLAFRPHIKTHKIPEIARMQIEAGAVGIACQKLSEAEVFTAAGFNDIQIPYNIVGEKKTRRLAELALYHKITVSADHIDVVHGLSQAAKEMDSTIRILVDVATDIKRTGAPAHQLVDLARRIEDDMNLHFAGVLIYPSDPVNRPILQEVLAGLNGIGLGVDVVSGGGFGASRFAAEMPELTELRVGTYVFGDYASVFKEWCKLDDCAMKVAATVVSRASAERGILDCGSKTLAADRINDRHGYIMEYPEAHIYQLSEEHAHVDFGACETRPVIGERVHVIPVHTCVVTNLHNQIYGVRGEDVEVTWPVAARGLVW